MKVLSIDGGGIRGLIPALVLAEIERRTQKRAADLFDLIAGTSTGGIIALGVTAPADDGGSRWSAADLAGLYETEGPRIFSRSLGRQIESAKGLLDEKFDAKHLEQALAHYFGDAKLSEAVTDVIVTSYDLESRTPWFFKRREAREDARWDLPMRVAARATSAAPTYFEPIALRAGGHKLALVDGGVYANNPSMCAYAEVRRYHPRAAVTLVSLGTGQLTKPIHYADARDWGLVNWARPIIEVVFDGVSDTIDYQLDQLLGLDRHHRFQVPLHRARDALDDASAENIADLRAQAEELISEHSGRLDALCEALTSDR